MGACACVCMCTCERTYVRVGENKSARVCMHVRACAIARKVTTDDAPRRQTRIHLHMCKCLQLLHPCGPAQNVSKALVALGTLTVWTTHRRNYRSCLVGLLPSKGDGPHEEEGGRCPRFSRGHQQIAVGIVIFRCCSGTQMAKGRGCHVRT